MADKISAKTVTDNLRNKWVGVLLSSLEEEYEVMQTASGTLYIADLDELNDDRWIKLSIIIPKASEEEGTDGYALAEEYRQTLAEREEVRKRKEAEKAAKIAKDAAKRAERAKKKESGE